MEYVQQKEIYIWKHLFFRWQRVIQGKDGVQQTLLL